ncbi:hypothetical protein EDB85DRAFT_2277516 [Lactarius pseudohatsudake]|nr:hypothetical protein EDB85DRAFT_2277516 [Lactarius pseudohatsudake]
MTRTTLTETGSGTQPLPVCDPVEQTMVKPVATSLSLSHCHPAHNLGAAYLLTISPKPGLHTRGAGGGALLATSLAINTMSSSPQASPSSTPNFQPIFEKALKEYKKKTGKDLTAHPLAAEIKSCDSPDAILTVLEGKANELNQSRSSDDRLTKWLNPTVNILNALSAILGEGAGSVFPPTKIIFSGIGILLLAATSTAADHDMLVKLFNRIERFFKRLKIYINVPPSPAVTDELSKIIAEVLSILAIVTKIMKEGRIKRFLRKLAGMNYLEDALQRFDKLEQRELLTGIAQVYGDFNVLKHGV